MNKSDAVKIPATEVHRNFAEVIRRAFTGNEHFVVEKDGLPVVAILSIQEYETLMNEANQAVQSKLERRKLFRSAAQNIGEAIEAQGLTEEDVDAIVEQTRQDIYDSQRKPFNG
jgi:prevent-host-death family protein